MKLRNLGLAALAVALGGPALADDLPRSMVWSSYDVGSQGYSEASAIADAFGKKFGTRIRIQPSGTSIGRLQPLLGGRAAYGFLATETFFATEGTEDFARPDWGPQDLRVVAGRPGSTGMVTSQESGIETIAEVKGHRLALTAGNASINVKCAALLSFAGLTLDDVELVMFPTYAAAQASITNGEADVTCGATTSSAMYELEASPRGIKWLPVPASNTEGWEKLTAVAPFFAPYEETQGAGLSAEHPGHIVALRYPIIVTLADADDDAVYAFTKALDETYGLYKNATSVTDRWALEQSGVGPVDAPFHEGAIRYLKEKGIWTEKEEEWNARRLARLEALQAAWKTYKAENADLSEEDFVKGWTEKHDEVLASL
ncbi:TAXI family TRAP transporter solute-binding subunit [Acuticoccus mangrovi]|uniref:TAXI family TRAP transporter solute-binding subunit n=1 Tax=Acuticoccus mangrovi TaxID=2796142 RepID=A0A934ISU4_9HYPH|nr:TAXI family TRAP transporter solute-binding subunit [Acuticoccus mangrovi]MBJ3777039.1 TAXI family TRAP transporter solute-binding subunit [Acuticoccus mangrovi]